MCSERGNDLNCGGLSWPGKDFEVAERFVFLFVLIKYAKLNFFFNCLKFIWTVFGVVNAQKFSVSENVNIQNELLSEC